MSAKKLSRLLGLVLVIAAVGGASYALGDVSVHVNAAHLILFDVVWT